MGGVHALVHAGGEGNAQVQLACSFSQSHGCMRQGDLTDPAYFDYISFAQLATISREIPVGRQAFEVLPWPTRQQEQPMLCCLCCCQDRKMLHTAGNACRRPEAECRKGSWAAAGCMHAIEGLRQPRAAKSALACALQEFCEDCDGQRRQVTRPPEYADNAALSAAFEARTGDNILDGLMSGFRVNFHKQRRPLPGTSPEPLAFLLRAVLHAGDICW